MNKISIKKEVLRKLYEDKKLSARAIARIFDCHQAVILRELRKYGIEVRNPNKKIAISKEELHNLYVNKRLSTYKIAKLYNCDNKTIYTKLRQYGIKTRPITKIMIPKEELYHLYCLERLPVSKIAKKYSCFHSLILNRMRKYEISRRTMSEVKTIYPKHDFSGDLIEKSYLIGFRLGDLHVFKKNFLVYVNSNTTRIEQVELITKLFEKYSKVYVKQYENGRFNQQIGLNKSFEFLVPKRDVIENWILESNQYFLAFLAGYTDAEGNIGVYGDQARFRIRTYDKNILSQIHQKLKSMNIDNKYVLEISVGKYNNHQDCWCVSINKMKDLLNFFKLIEPYLRHAKRRKDLKTAENNILLRLKNEST